MMSPAEYPLPRNNSTLCVKGGKDLWKAVGGLSHTEMSAVASRSVLHPNTELDHIKLFLLSCGTALFLIYIYLS